MMLSKDEIISNKKEINKNNKNIIKGVYFLINNNDLVYVGESQDIFNRIRSHSYLKTKRFNAFNFIIIDNDDDRKFTEYMYIRPFIHVDKHPHPPPERRKQTECISPRINFVFNFIFGLC